MKPIFRKLLSAALAAAMLSSSLSAAASEALGSELAIRRELLSGGTELAAGTFWSDTHTDLRRENYIVYTPGEQAVPIVTYGSSTRSLTPLSVAAKTLEDRGLRVVAGVNGDYYGTMHGVPLGCTIVEGVLRNGNHDPYSVVGFRADGTALIGAPRLTMELRAGGVRLGELFAFNHVRQSEYGLFLYDHDFNDRHTTGTSEPGVDLVCSVTEGTPAPGKTLKLRVEEVLTEAVDTAVPEGCFVLSANEKAADAAALLKEKLPQGTEFEINIYFAQSQTDATPDQRWNDVVNLIGAPEMLVENGKVVSGLQAGSAPRTAVGLRGDGSVLFYTIDGRQSGFSIGASLTALAMRMVELGCVTAAALDGGGSTTLAATLPDKTAAQLINSPSEGRERSVTNHLFLVAPNTPGSEAHHVYLRPESVRVLPGARVPVAAALIDDHYIPTGEPVSLFADRGTIDGSDLIAPDTLGSLNVSGTAGGKSSSVSVTVSAPDDILVTRDGKTVSNIIVTPESVTKLSATGYLNHLPLFGGNECFTWTLDGEGLTLAPDGTLTAGKSAAAGSLTVSAAGKSVQLPVSVAVRPLRLLNGFDEAFEPITDLPMDAEEGAVPALTLSQAVDAAHVRTGTGSGRLNYALTGTEAAELPMSYPIEEGYDCVELWVYGDGSRVSLALNTDAGLTDAAVIRHTGWAPIALTFPKEASWITGLSVKSTGEGGVTGTIWLDQLVMAYAYTVDVTGPEVSLSLNEETNTVQGRAFDAIGSVELPTLRLRYDGTDLPFSMDERTGSISASLPERDGLAHRITLTAGDASGNLSRVSVDIPVSADVEPAFPDTADHWGNGAIGYLKRTGVSNGDNGKYRPDANISRQEFAAMLYRYLSPQEDFSDVKLPFADADKISSWARPAAKAMYALGIIMGTKGNAGILFKPSDNISRQEAVTMLGRLMEKGYAEPKLTYSDAGSIPSWSASHIATLGAMGVFDEFVDDTFQPTLPITRAQVASILFRMN